MHLDVASAMGVLCDVPLSNALSGRSTRRLAELLCVFLVVAGSSRGTRAAPCTCSLFQTSAQGNIHFSMFSIRGRVAVSTRSIFDQRLRTVSLGDRRVWSATSVGASDKCAALGVRHRRTRVARYVPTVGVISH